MLYPTYTHRGDGVVPFGIAALALALYTLLHPGLREVRRAEHDAAEPPTSEPANEHAAGEGDADATPLAFGHPR